MKERIFLISKQKRMDVFQSTLCKDWTNEEEQMLLEICKSRGRKYWSKIIHKFPNKTVKELKNRMNNIDPNIQYGKWTPSEDKMLLSLVGSVGFSWKLISKIMKNRNEKQIRAHYTNFLFPGINKKKFDAQEDEILLNNFKQLETNWTKYCPLLPGRSPRQIENRMKSLFNNISKENDSSTTDVKE